MNNIKFIGIIPARYESTRFPGKPLAMLGEKPVIQWVYENVSNVLKTVYVATDDDRIYAGVEEFGGNVVKTSDKHKSGTDRCAEAAQKLSSEIDFDVVINIQGDEPFVTPEQIELLKSCFESDAAIATLVKKIESTEELYNPNRPKVVLDREKNALYFSRSPIPFVRGAEKKDWILKNVFWVHIGMYAFKADVLQRITTIPQSNLELAESLEQLRWLENGYTIKTAETLHQTIGIDTPEDLEAAVQRL